MAENTKLKVVGGSVVADIETNRELVRSDPGKMIELVSGSIKVSVAKQIDGRSFVVRSSQAEMRVVGTKFSIGIGANRKQTWLDVQEGVVQMSPLSGGATLDVREGMKADAEEGKTIKVMGAVKKVKEFLLPEELRDARVLACDGKLLWLSLGAGTRLYGMDPDSREILRMLDLKGKISVVSLAYGGDALWAAGQGKDIRANGLFRIRVADGEVEQVASIGTPDSIWNILIAYGGGYVWVAQKADGGGSRISRFDPKIGKIVGESPDLPYRVYGLTSLNDGLCVVTTDGGASLIRVDPADGKECIRIVMPFEGRGALDPAEEHEGKFWGLKSPSGRVILFENLLGGVDAGGKGSGKRTERL
jgi:hypothetical protein